jgi:tousled-like kinase
VWSVGCKCLVDINQIDFVVLFVGIFYQCLYGRKPYGHSLSQAAVLENEIILNATEIQFPSRPQVSNEAKLFIRRCLTYQVRDRPDVLQLSEDEYLKSYSKRTTLTSSSILFRPK